MLTLRLTLRPFASPRSLELTKQQPADPIDFFGNYLLHLADSMEAAEHVRA